tara:strand:- start:3217 stop:3423 length:207 start_codon:yes stop_codon:yes gene_type:complete
MVNHRITLATFTFTKVGLPFLYNKSLLQSSNTTGVSALSQITMANKEQTDTNSNTAATATSVTSYVPE